MTEGCHVPGGQDPAAPISPPPRARPLRRPRRTSRPLPRDAATVELDQRLLQEPGPSRRGTPRAGDRSSTNSGSDLSARAAAAAERRVVLTRRSRRNQTMVVSRAVRSCPHPVILSCGRRHGGTPTLYTPLTPLHRFASSMATNLVHASERPMTKHTLTSSQIVRRTSTGSGTSSPGREPRTHHARSMGFEIRTPDAATRAGAVIDYTIRPLLGIPTHLAHAHRRWMRPTLP